MGVFVDCELRSLRGEVEASGVSVIQLHGSEPPSYLEQLLPWRVIKAFRLRDAKDLNPLARYLRASAFLLDAYVEEVPGGTGRTFEYSLAVRAQNAGKPLILAGGLCPRRTTSTTCIRSPALPKSIPTTPVRTDNRSSSPQRDS